VADSLGRVQNVIGALKHAGTVNADLHLLKSGWVTAHPGEAKRHQEWQARTSKRFFTYQGFGDHDLMLEGANVSVNCAVLRTIFDRVLGTEPELDSRNAVCENIEA
jgi:hypothetical protein